MSTNSRFDLDGRTVIITGGGKGIGKVYAQEFARAGARVVAADIDRAAAEENAQALAAEGFQAIGIAADVADPTSTEAMAQAALDRFGRAIERPQVPEDLVGAVMFLFSPASDFMTGQTINVDGGKAMH